MGVRVPFSSDRGDLLSHSTLMCVYVCDMRGPSTHPCVYRAHFKGTESPRDSPPPGQRWDSRRADSPLFPQRGGGSPGHRAGQTGWKWIVGARGAGEGTTVP